MRSFVKMDKSGVSQSLYTKYLLQHIRSSESIGSLFEKLNCSFTKGEDASIVAKMKPEYKDSTRQKFSIASPLRQSSAVKLQKLFFKNCRMESLSKGHDFEDHSQCSLGLCWCHETNAPNWIIGKTEIFPEILIRLSVKSIDFLNEANLKIGVTITDSKTDWAKNCSVQVIPVNHCIIFTEKSHDFCYNPCSKRGMFDRSDGPVFILPSETTQYSDIGNCHIPALQTVNDQVLKFRVIFWAHGFQIPCKGLLTLSVPLCQNMPNLKMCNF